MNEICKMRDALAEDLSMWKVDSPCKDIFMLGNGRVSAFLGWGERLTDLGWILGPYYETDFNRPYKTSTYFGTQTLRLYSERDEPVWVKTSLGRARKTDIMLSRHVSRDGLRWDVIDFCSPFKNEIMRIMIFENTGSNVLPEYRLQIGWQKPEEHKRIWEPEICFDSDRATGGTVTRISLLDAGGKHRRLIASLNVYCENLDGTIQVKIPALKPNSVFIAVQLMTITAGNENEAAVKTVTSEYALESLKSTVEYWNKWSDSGALVRTSVEWFDDLLDSVKIWCKVQESHHKVFTPMAFYSDAYVRDCNGPVRLFLRLGMFDEVRGVLDFFRKAAVYNYLKNPNRSHSGVNNVLLDVDAFPDEADIDWNEIDPGRAEIPSWIILWHWWYYQQTKDMDYVRKNWRFLVRCLESQRVTRKGFVRFHGDETYKYLGHKSCTGIDLPEYIRMFDSGEDSHGSFESTVLFLYAYDAMDNFADKLGTKADLKDMMLKAARMKAGLEEELWDEKDGCYRMADGEGSRNFENPHTIVLSTPCWLDAFSNISNPALNEKRAEASWEKCLDFLDKEGWINASPYLPVNDGHLPGFMLCGSAIYDKSKILRIIEKTKEIASPAGAFAEYYTSFDADGARGYHGKAWGRLRPWESGINLESILFALTGFRFDADTGILIVSPWLPEGWEFFEISRYSCSGTKLSLSVKRNGESLEWNIRNDGVKSIEIKSYKELKDNIILKPGEIYYRD